MILAILLLFGGLLAVLYAAGELVSKRSSESRLIVCLLLSIALMLVHAALLLLDDVSYRIPQILGWYLPGMLFIGPVLLRYVQMRMHLTNDTWSWKIHLTPSFVSIIGLLLVFNIGTHEKIALISNLKKGVLPNPYDWFTAITSLHPISYAIYGILFLIRTSQERRFQSEVLIRILFFLMFTLGVISLLLFIGFLLHNTILISFGAMLCIFFLLALYLIGRRFPGFFEDLQLVIEKGKYKNSQLKGKDFDSIKQQLETLMKEEHLYRDDGLTLATLANKLQLSKHQLSEYFNVQLNENFSRYINHYRIEAACDLLLQYPDKTVLSIAYEVGFNSKSVFNTTFLRVKGLSPSAFRMQNKPF
ncbi:helix-turn-helix domain-containing protein [Leptospira jelokensis]|uniref:helix-turn-helix domain-containing protein n=1 Tax=Leptospira jelokensis TaxID=2484931 RepID=UPI0010916B38|nr:helix-turn-helix domain-containing protein [Leptospira jelokensis]TGM01681.1 helix-turn-helix domain-containing protein [Leptospira jelokensis]